MRYRVREILLVASLYDSYVLESDGALSEQIYGEFFKLNLTTAPRVTCAYTPDSAMEMFGTEGFDMVILMAGLDFDVPLTLATRMKSVWPEVPVLLLAMNNSSLAGFDDDNQACRDSIDRIFVWNGYSKLFVGMIKYVEDLRNVDTDTRGGMVRGFRPLLFPLPAAPVFGRDETDAAAGRGREVRRDLQDPPHARPAQGLARYKLRRSRRAVRPLRALPPDRHIGRAFQQGRRGGS